MFVYRSFSPNMEYQMDSRQKSSTFSTNTFTTTTAIGTAPNSSPEYQSVVALQANSLSKRHVASNLDFEMDTEPEAQLTSTTTTQVSNIEIATDASNRATDSDNTDEQQTTDLKPAVATNLDFDSKTQSTDGTTTAMPISSTPAATYASTTSSLPKDSGLKQTNISNMAITNNLDFGHDYDARVEETTTPQKKTQTHAQLPTTFLESQPPFETTTQKQRQPPTQLTKGTHPMTTASTKSVGNSLDFDEDEAKPDEIQTTRLTNTHNSSSET